MLYAMIARDKPGTNAQRQAVRPVHLEHLDSLGQRLQLAGALLGEGDAPIGSLIVFEAGSLEEARAMAEADPFVQQGIFDSIEVRPWRVAINNMAPKE